MTMPKALTIAGSDSSGGAGLQADLKTFQELGVYGMTAITTIVAMDPHNRWAHQVFPVDLATIEAQLETIIVGVGVDAFKTGMLPTTDIIELAARAIEKHGLKNAVIDPVMVCKGADEPLHPENTVCYRETLVPKATVVTPNLFEAAQLAGLPRIETVEDMKEAAGRIHELGAQYVSSKADGKFRTTMRLTSFTTAKRSSCLSRNGLTRRIRTAPAARSRPPLPPNWRKAGR